MESSTAKALDDRWALRGGSRAKLYALTWRSWRIQYGNETQEHYSAIGVGERPTDAQPILHTSSGRLKER